MNNIQQQLSPMMLGMVPMVVESDGRAERSFDKKLFHSLCQIPVLIGNTLLR